MSRFFLGLDLGQAQDYTALAVLQQIDNGEYHARHLERFALGTPYPAIVERVRSLMLTRPLLNSTALVVDRTGVGAAVVDLFRRDGLRPVAVTITGGNEVTGADGGYNVPKRDLVSTLQVLFQIGRLKVAAGLPEARLFMNEILNFHVKIDSQTAHDSYGSWREGTHDDLVLAVALAAWYAERRRKKAPVPKPAGW